MTYDNWKTSEPDWNEDSEPDFNEEAEERSAGRLADSEDYCDECGDEVATKLWDAGDIYASAYGVRYIPVCEACFNKLEGGPSEPDYDAPTARETYERSWQQKYNGKGL